MNRFPILGVFGVLFLAQAYGHASVQAPSSLVFFLQSTPSACDWKLADSQGLEIRTWLSTIQCPDQIVWDSAAHEVIYSMEQGLYRASWSGKGVPEWLGDTGPADDLWISLEQGTLRKIFWVELQPGDLISHGKDHFFSYKGEFFPVPGQSSAHAGMAVIEEWGMSGWTPVAARSLKKADYDTLGMDFLSSLRESRPGTFTWKELSRNASSDGGSPSGPEFGDHPVLLPASLHWLIRSSYPKVATNSPGRP